MWSLRRQGTEPSKSAGLRSNTAASKAVAARHATPSPTATKTLAVKRPPPSRESAGRAHVVLRLEDLPAYTQVLSSRGEIAALMRRDERNDVIVLDAPASGQMDERVVQVLCTNDYVSASTGFSDFRRRLQERQYTLSPAVPTRVSPEIISVLYANDAEKSRVVVNDAESTQMREMFINIASEAIDANATDIHLDIRGGGATVRHRIYKQLVAARSLDGPTALKLLRATYMSIAEPSSRSDPSFNPRARQGCAIELTLRGNLYRFRYQHLPIAPHGVDAAIRILPVSSGRVGRKTFQQLGYTPAQSDLIEEMFARPEGAIIIAGVTNSGKSTTLMQAISGLIEKKPYIKVRTVEDPVEYVIHGASQTPVMRSDKDDASTDETTSEFALTMKAVMRSDPDFIMVGEVRDSPTAKLLVQATQSGHQVATTNHADSAFGIIPRLIELGVPVSVLATRNFIAGLLYQKLLPLVCPSCGIRLDTYKPQNDIQESLLIRVRAAFGDRYPEIRFRGPGCDTCGHMGVKGLTVSAEVVRLSHDMRKLIRDEKFIEAEQLWRDQAQAPSEKVQGLTVFGHGLMKFIAGSVAAEDIETAFGYLNEALFEEALSRGHLGLVPGIAGGDSPVVPIAVEGHHTQRMLTGAQA